MKGREEIINNRFQFIEEEIDIRVESIKQMADQYGDMLKNKMRKLKKEKFSM